MQFNFEIKITCSQQCDFFCLSQYIGYASPQNMLYLLSKKVLFDKEAKQKCNSILKSKLPVASSVLAARYRN